jgi:hypothetical protein
MTTSGAIRDAARGAALLAALAFLATAGCGAGGPIDRALFGRRPTETPPPPARMDEETLVQLLRQEGEDVRHRDGVIELRYRGVRMSCVVSERFDRLRLYAPIVEVDQLTPEQRERVLEANFRALLDVRYATHSGMLYAVYLHPLSGLTSIDVRSALYQVANAASSFGSDYSSGIFHYVEPNEPL